MDLHIRKTRKGHLHCGGSDKEGKIRIISQDLVITGLSWAFGKCTVIMIPYSENRIPSSAHGFTFHSGLQTSSEELRKSLCAAL